jgi:hypothetical protein
LDRLFAKEVVDPIDLVFRQHLEDLCIEGLRGRKIVSEGFFDDHPPPCSAQLFGQSRVTELFDDRPEEALADRQIEQDIGDIVLLSLPGQQLLEISESFGLRKIRRNIVHAIGEP